MVFTSWEQKQHTSQQKNGGATSDITLRTPLPHTCIAQEQSHWAIVGTFQT